MKLLLLLLFAAPLAAQSPSPAASPMPNQDLMLELLRVDRSANYLVRKGVDVHADAFFAADGDVCVPAEEHGDSAAERAGDHPAGDGDGACDFEASGVCDGGDREVASWVRGSSAGLERGVAAGAAGHRV